MFELIRIDLNFYLFLVFLFLTCLIVIVPYGLNMILKVIWLQKLNLVNPIVAHS